MGTKTARLDDRIRFGEKAAFALGNFGSIPIMSLISSFLLLFYTDVVGLNPASVATLFLISRLLDGLNDPIMGYIIDHLPRTKLGRFRTYMLIGTVLVCINYVLLWFGPAWATTGKMVVAYISYLLIGITFDIKDIPQNSLIPVMTDKENERSSLSAIKGMCYVLGGMVFAVGAPMLLDNMGMTLEAFYVLIFGTVAIVLMTTIINVAGVRERIEPIDQDAKYRISDLFKFVLAAPVFSTFLATLFFGIAVSISSTSNVYFFIYVLDNQLDIMGITSMLQMLGLLPAILFSGLLVKGLGKKGTFVVGLLLAGLGPLIRLLSITSIPLLHVSNILMGAGLGLITTLMYSIGADNVDYIEYQYGQRAEGALASLSSFVAKAGQGIGGAVAGYVLAATGYIASQAQSRQAVSGIIANVVVLPGIISLVACVIFIFGYKISKSKVTEITEELRARREAGAAKE